MRKPLETPLGQLYLKQCKQSDTEPSISFNMSGENHLVEPIMYNWHSSPFKETLGLPGVDLMEVTKYYFTGVDSFLGTQPFYTLINGMYRLTGKELQTYLFKQEPFARELIIDTFNFVLTGTRDINVNVLRLLVEAGRKIDTDYDRDVNLNVQVRYDVSTLESMSSTEFFKRWVSQRNGISDLICSYKILLGL